MFIFVTIIYAKETDVVDSYIQEWVLVLDIVQ